MKTFLGQAYLRLVSYKAKRASLGLIKFVHTIQHFLFAWLLSLVELKVVFSMFFVALKIVNLLKCCLNSQHFVDQTYFFSEALNHCHMCIFQCDFTERFFRLKKWASFFLPLSEFLEFDFSVAIPPFYLAERVQSDLEANYRDLSLSKSNS